MIDDDSVQGSWEGKRGLVTRTVRISLGDLDARPTSGLEPVDGNVEKAYTYGVREQVTPTDLGYEYAWTFEPAGGPLTVTLAVNASGEANVDETGIHFTVSDRPFAVSHATWIDADGKQVPVSGIYEAGRITYEVPVDVVARSRFPAKLDPTVGPEWPVAPAPKELPIWNAAGADVMVTPTGKIVTVRFSWSGDEPPPASTIRYFEIAGGTTNLLAEGYFNSLSVFPDLRIVATCGGRDCIALLDRASDALVMRRLDLLSLTWLDDSAPLVVNAQGPLAFAFDGTSYLLCWSNYSASAYCRVFDGALGAAGPPQLIAVGATSAWEAAAQPGRFAVTYKAAKPTPGTDTPCDPVSATQATFAAFIDAATGAVIAGPKVVGATADAPTNARLIAEDAGFLVVRSVNNDLCAQRFTSLGADEGGTFTVVHTVGSDRSPGLSAAAVGQQGTLVSVSSAFMGEGFEIARGASTFVRRAELPWELVAGVGDGAFLGMTPEIPTTLRGISQVLGYYTHDAMLDTYVRSQSLPVATHVTFRTEMQLARDDATDSYFVGWLDRGGYDTPDAGRISPEPYKNASLMVNVFDARATSPKNATPIVLPGDGTELDFIARDPLREPMASLTWSIGAGLGMAIVLYDIRTSSGSRLAAQRIRSDGTLIDASPVFIGETSESVRLTHGSSHYFAELSTCSPGTCTGRVLELDPVASDLSPILRPDGTPVPQGPPVAGRLAAYTLGGSLKWIVDSSTLSVVAPIESSSWSPAPDPNSSIAVVSGSDGFVALYPVTDSTMVRAYCARLDPNGTLIGISECTPAGAPWTGYSTSSAGKLLQLDWGSSFLSRFDEATGRMLAPLQFTPTRPMPSHDMVGGPEVALIGYLGQWTSRFGSTAIDVYARWITPASSDGESCDEPAECISRACVSNVCVPQPPDAGVPADACSGPACAPSAEAGRPSDSSLDSALSDAGSIDGRVRDASGSGGAGNLRDALPSAESPSGIGGARNDAADAATQNETRAFGLRPSSGCECTMPSRGRDRMAGSFVAIIALCASAARRTHSVAGSKRLLRGSRRLLLPS